MGKQFGKAIMPQVLELKTKGHTLKMIGDELGYTKKQIKNLLYRQRKIKSGTISIPQKRGRPRKRPISTEDEYRKRIKQLGMENDLLRAFLQKAGRTRGQRLSSRQLNDIEINIRYRSCVRSSTSPAAAIMHTYKAATARQIMI